MLLHLTSALSGSMPAQPQIQIYQPQKSGQGQLAFSRCPSSWAAAYCSSSHGRRVAAAPMMDMAASRQLLGVQAKEASFV